MKLPELKDADYARLREEMRAAIPRFSKDWDNFNPSDPGITILELLAYVGETLLYRMDRVPARSYLNYLRLLAGAAGADTLAQLQAADAQHDPGRRRLLEVLRDLEARPLESITNADIRRMQAEAQEFFARPYRAITEADFHTLALEAIDQIPPDENDSGMDAFVRYEEPVTELVLISRRYGHGRDLYDRETRGETLTLARRAGHPDARFEALRRKTAEYLSRRTLIGTRLRVRWPEVTPVNIELQVRIPEFYRPGRVLESVGQRLLEEFDAAGSAEKAERAYDRPIQYNRLQGCLEEVPGVAGVEELRIDYDGPAPPGPDEANPWYVPVRGLARVTQLRLRRVQEKRHV